MEFPLPRMIGCVRCGDESPRQHAVFAQCNTCGKTCGVCRPCSRFRGAGFLRDAMDWHRERRHPDLFLPPDVRRQLTSTDRLFRVRGQRVVL